MYALEALLIEVDVSRELASRIAWALRKLRVLGVDGLSPALRSKYRKELAKLGSPPWDRSKVVVRTIRAKGAYTSSTGPEPGQGRQNALFLAFPFALKPDSLAA
jgi:hypothetical protein